MQEWWDEQVEQIEAEEREMEERDDRARKPSGYRGAPEELLERRVERRIEEALRAKRWVTASEVRRFVAESFAGGEAEEEEEEAR
jgi:hypothetical protein